MKCITKLNYYDHFYSLAGTEPNARTLISDSAFECLPWLPATQQLQLITFINPQAATADTSFNIKLICVNNVLIQKEQNNNKI